MTRFRKICGSLDKGWVFGTTDELAAQLDKAWQNAKLATDRKPLYDMIEHRVYNFLTSQKAGLPVPKDVDVKRTKDGNSILVVKGIGYTYKGHNEGRFRVQDGKFEKMDF